MAKKAKVDEERSVRVTLRIPMLMRQAIRDREKLSKQSAAGIIQGILLTSLRVEMEILRREKDGKPASDRRQIGANLSESSLRKVQ